MIKKIKELPIDLAELNRKLLTKISEILPEVVAVEARNHFEASWDNQGFTNKVLKKWQKRQFNGKSKLKGGTGVTSAYKKFCAKDKGRAILVGHASDTKGAHLKDSIQVEKKPTQVIFSTDKVYAQVHNEGGRAGRGKGFIMPQRQFLGESEVLNAEIEKKMTKEINKFLDTLNL